MYRILLLCLCLLLGLTGTAMPQTKKPVAKKTDVKEQAAQEPVAKQLSGMSIVGNDEAPKALYIVPWKSSELGGETGLNMMLDDRAAPVDREVFLRQLNFFEISTKK